MKLGKFMGWKLVIVLLSLPIALMAIQLGSTENFTNNISPWIGTPTTGIRQYSNSPTKRMEIDSQATASRTYTFSGYENQPFRMTLTTTEIGTWEGSSDTTIIKFNGVVVYNSDVAGNLVLQGGFDSSGTVAVTITTNTNATAEKLHVDNINIYSDPNYTLSNLRPFSQAFTSNEKGNIKIIGNSVLKPDSTECATQPNNSVTAVNTDKDSDSTTFNSTSANLNLPAGVTGSNIKYAALYWQGRLAENSLSTNVAAAAKTVKLKLFGGNYQTLTSMGSKFNWRKSSGNGDDYQGVVDITTSLRANVNSYATAAGYTQPIWVADVLTHTGATNLFGAWSIVIVYHDDTTTLKNLTVYDGYLGINKSTSTAEKTVTLSGFVTPSTYPINASFLIFGGEGDVNYGDSVSLSNSSGTDIKLNSGGEVFKSSITDESGNNVTSRNPSCANTIGADIHSFNIGKSSAGDTVGIIGTNQTTTTVKLDSFMGSFTDYDTYFPGVFAFATDLYEPDVCYIENIFQGTTNISGVGAQVDKDANLTVRVYIKNKGAEAASGVSIVHQFDTSFPYVENSANYNNSNPAYETVMPPLYARTTATDTAGDDLYEYNSATLRTKINLGADANISSGGTFTPNTTTAVFEYSATVKILDSNYSNEYKAGYVNNVLHVDYTNNPVAISSCDGSRNSFWGFVPASNPGSIDAVTNYTANGYTQDEGLMSRIASQQNVTFDIVWLGTGTTPVNYPYEKPMPVMITLSDAACSTDESITSGGSYVEATLTDDGNAIATTSPFELTSKTMSSAKLRLKYIDWNNLPGGDYSNCINVSSTLGALSGVPACINNDNNIKAAFGEDIYQTCANTGVRPACQSNSYNAGNLPSEPYNNELGCFICLANALNGPTCSSDEFAIRPDTYTAVANPSPITAGEDFIFTTTAKGYNNTSLTGYNGTAAITPQTQIAACLVDDGNLTDDTNTTFSAITFDGADKNITNNIKFGDVGVFDINITDSTWTNVDNPNECIVDSDTNTTDANGKVGCLVRGIHVQKVIPDHFDVNGTLENGSTGFTYLHNNDSNATLDQNISAILNSNVTAKSSLNGTTRNYAGDCYAKDGNSTLTFSFNPAITPAGSLNNGLWYDDVNSSNTGSSFAIGTTPTLNHPKERFFSGVGNLRYRLNFDRNVTQSVNPFMMSIPDMAVVDADNVDGNNSIDNNATYVYGRTHASRQIYQCAGSPCVGSANIYFESFCFGAGCDKNLLPNNLASKRIDDVRWFWNENHIANDGNVTIVVQKGGANTNADTVRATDNPVVNLSVSVTDPTYHGTSYPYKTTMENGASPWLIYNESDPTATRNEFQVEFHRIGNWTGAHETNTTTKTPAGAITNRRIMW